MKKDLFRKKRVYITNDDHAAIDKIKEAAEKLRELIFSSRYQMSSGISNLPELILAEQKLEECVMWANKTATAKYYEHGEKELICW